MMLGRDTEAFGMDAVALGMNGVIFGFKGSGIDEDSAKERRVVDEEEGSNAFGSGRIDGELLPEVEPSIPLTSTLSKY